VIIEVRNEYDTVQPNWGRILFISTASPTKKILTMKGMRDLLSMG